jgi:hypothetical protein
MIRLSILTGAATVAGLLAFSAAAQTANPGHEAKGGQAQREASARQPADSQSEQAATDEQRILWMHGLEVYEAKYGSGSYDAYARAHPEVTTVQVTPAGKEVHRGTVRVIESQAR